MVMATDLAQGNLKAERPRRAISSLAGGRRSYGLSQNAESAARFCWTEGRSQPWEDRQASDSSRSVVSLGLEGGFLVNAFDSWEAEKIICLFDRAMRGQTDK